MMKPDKKPDELQELRSMVETLYALPGIQQLIAEDETRRKNIATAKTEHELQQQVRAAEIEALRRAAVADPLCRVAYVGAGSGVVLTMHGEDSRDTWLFGLRDRRIEAGAFARWPYARLYRRSDLKTLLAEGAGQIEQLIDEGVIEITELDAADVAASAELRSAFTRSKVRAT